MRSAGSRRRGDDTAGWKELSLKGELVSFRATDGAILSAMLSRPKGSKIAVIHLHGLNSAFYKPLPMKMGMRLVRHGITFMSIQQRGSYREYDLDLYRGNKWRRIHAGGRIERFEDSVYDIEGAIRYLRRVGIDRIYLQGHSTGCQKSVYYAIRNNDRAVKGIILLAPADDRNIWKSNLYGFWGRGKRKGFAEAIRFARSKTKAAAPFWMDTRYGEELRYTARRFLSFADIRNVEARIFDYESPKLREFARVRVPVLAVFGTRDQYLVKSAKECMRELGRDTGSPLFMGILIKNTNHGFANKEKELAELVSDWVLDRERASK